MITQDKIPELEKTLSKVANFRMSSMASISLMVLGVVTIIAALAFSISRLRPLEKQADELRNQTESLRVELDTTRRELENVRQQAEIMRLGASNLQSRKYAEAIEQFDAAIALDPKNSNPYNYKGYAQLRSDQTASAIETFKLCSQIDPANAWCHYNLALAYWQSGNETLALDEVRKTLEIDPVFRNRFINDVQFNKFKSSSAYRELIEIQR